MKALIVHAHPVPDSLNRALVTAAVEGLTTAGSPPVTASLCDGEDPTDDDLRTVEALVFVYPTWWGGPPAILLDWIDRRIGPWIDEAPDAPPPLAAVRHLAAVTTHGSPRMMNRLTGEPGRHLLTDSIRPLCADSCRWEWIAYYGIDADDADGRSAFVAGVPGRLQRLVTSA